MIAYLLPMLGVWLLLTVLYLWMVMPRMWNGPGKEPFMGVLYAHRGLFDHSAVRLMRDTGLSWTYS